MMGVYRSIAGSLRVKVMSADVALSLQILEQEGLSLFSVQVEDSVTVTFTVPRRDFSKLEMICHRKGYVIKTVRRSGLYWPLRTLCARPVLLLGMIMLLIVAICIPGRILFISTEGNTSVPTRLILEQAEACGLKFWANRRSVRSEQVKNVLLEAIPQLQWVGVNTYGCRGIIMVRERPEKESDENTGGVSHIVADRDGVISSCTVTGGSSTCTVGQAVKKGDILISGYTDCGLALIAERAEGEIFAQTKRIFNVLSPRVCQIQSVTGQMDTKYSLLIGKKRINFYKGSGISGGSCDKMYSKYVLRLPGGFVLPVALLKESVWFCGLTETATDVPVTLLQSFASQYLTGQMNDGTILRKNEICAQEDGVVLLEGTYDCLEQIGITKDEMIGDIHG